MFYPTERKNIVQGAALTNSAVNRFSNIFPLDGTGWTKLILTFNATVDWTDAAVVDRRGIFRYIKGISLKTSRGETIVDNVCGQALFIAKAIMSGAFPVYDVIRQADGTYRAVIEIYFAMPFLNRPEDTIFDSGRYSNLELSITTGSVLDLLNDATGESVSMTVDITVERTLSAITPDGKGKPYMHAYYRQYGPQVISAQKHFDLESSLDLGLFGFALKLAATGVTAPFDGAGVDNLLHLTFEDSVRTWVDRATPFGLKQELHNACVFDPGNIYIATPAAGEAITYPLLGVYPHLFVKNGSINEHYPTGKKSMIRVSFDDATTTDIANLVVWGFRALR